MSHPLLKQRSIGMSWGVFKLIAADISMFVQLLILAFSSIGAWSMLSLWLQGKGLVIAFWQFAVAIVVVILSISVLVWLLLIPSGFQAWSDQWWRHDNPLKQELDKQFTVLNKRLDKAEKQWRRACKQSKKKEGR